MSPARRSDGEPDTGGSVAIPVADPPRLAYTLTEVAAMLGLSLITIKRLVRKGELQSFKVGRVYRVRPEAIEAFISEREGAAHV